MTQRNVARRRALSPGSSARIAVAALVTVGLLGATPAAEAVQPRTAQPAPVHLAAAPRQAAITSPATATILFEASAFRAVPAPPPKPKAKPKTTVKPTVVKRHTSNTIHKTATKRVHRPIAQHVAKKPVKKRLVKHVTKRVKHKAKKAATKKVRHVKKTSRSTSRAGRSIISIARSKTGSPYRFGATGPNVFDCSGFVGYVYRRAGHSLPRMARDIYPAVRHVSNPRPGDIIFFINGGHATHVGIYAGHGMMYDSPRSGRTVGLHAYKYYNGAVRFGRA